MSRSFRPRLVLVVVTVGAALATPLPAGGQEPGFTPVTINAHWTIAGVEPGGRTLRLTYSGGGCKRDDARATIEESAEQIAIRVEQTEYRPAGPGFACTSDLRYHRLRVTLRAPVAGRRIVGAALTSPILDAPAEIRIEGPQVLFVIPRVIGLAPADAARVLRQQRFLAYAPRPAAGGRGRPAITEQLPSAGIAVGGPGGRMRVRLSST